MAIGLGRSEIEKVPSWPGVVPAIHVLAAKKDGTTINIYNNYTFLLALTLF
jgi:hypothetical protein